MTVRPITSKTEFDSLITSGKVVFVDFYADWCGPCKAISPVFDALARDNTREGVEFCKVDIDNVEEVAAELGIQSIPRFYVYKEGAKIGELVGANRDGLQSLVRTRLSM